MTIQKTARATANAFRLAQRSLAIVRKSGWRGLYTRARRKLLPSSNQVYAFEALDFAETFDFTPAELQRSAATMATHAGALPVQSVNWFLPHFDHAYYGGIYTILRFAAGFAQRH